MILSRIIRVGILVFNSRTGKSMEQTIMVSPLGKTWIFDIDGTICKHNGYKLDGHDTILPGAAEFFHDIPKEDKIVFLTSRKEEAAAGTEAFLEENGIRFDAILYDMPYGERILVNDKKPSGLTTGIVVNTTRDEFMETRFEVDPFL